MTFKLYDILSSLIPGFITLCFIFFAFNIAFDKDILVPYTAIAFLLGYVINTLGSWLEDLYCLSWGGKPSRQLLADKGIWKVTFYHGAEVRTLLQAETKNLKATDDELFNIAMRYANATKETRVEDFNSSYAFSRSLLTCVLISTIILLGKNYMDWHYYAILLPLLLIVWLRCKQRSYYYVKEVLTVYFKIKKAG